jgi:hypothetical protein
MDDYVTKPVRSQTLASVLRRWIDAADPAHEGLVSEGTASGELLAVGSTNPTAR